MTLHTHFQLSVAGQRGRIHDGAANGFLSGLTGAGCFDVGTTWLMTALAIDSFRDAVAE